MCALSAGAKAPPKPMFSTSKWSSNSAVASIEYSQSFEPFHIARNIAVVTIYPVVRNMKSIEMAYTSRLLPKVCRS